MNFGCLLNGKIELDYLKGPHYPTADFVLCYQTDYTNEPAFLMGHAPTEFPDEPLAFALNYKIGEEEESTDSTIESLISKDDFQSASDYYESQKEIEPLPVEYIFMIDRSASMGFTEGVMENAVEALTYFVQSLSTPQLFHVWIVLF